MSDTAVEVGNVIHSAEDFLAALKVGDVFWRMISRHFRPYAIEGPFLVLGFVKLGKEKFLNVKCSTHGKGRAKVEFHSINDLTNEHHGVFTDEKEAKAYFKDKQRAFDAQQRANDPKTS